MNMVVFSKFERNQVFKVFKHYVVRKSSHNHVKVSLKRISTKPRLKCKHSPVVALIRRATYVIIGFNPFIEYEIKQITNNSEISFANQRWRERGTENGRPFIININESYANKQTHFSVELFNIIWRWILILEMEWKPII